MDEVYGVLDWSWSKARNETVLPRIQALQRPIQGQFDQLRHEIPECSMFHPDF